MKIIVPMAGMGKRLRPHTLTIPKPLIPVAGKPIVQRLVEDITKVCGEPVEEIAYVVGAFGSEVESSLLGIAKSLGAKGSIYYQEQPLGTAHAILCAKKSLQGKVVVAFADTLFKADFTIDTSKDGIIWVKQIEDPRAFGVVKVDAHHVITDFVEKPQTFVSDLAIIGIYYFKDGALLAQELQYLIDHDIKDKGEYQLTSALEHMKKKGTKFFPGSVTEWLDCGNKDNTVYTNQRVLEFNRGEKNLVSPHAVLKDSVIIEPCFIAPHAEIIGSVVGPYVSVGAHTTISSSVVRNSIIQTHSKINLAVIDNSMIGNFVEYKGDVKDVSIGDFSVQR